VRAEDGQRGLDGGGEGEAYVVEGDKLRKGGRKEDKGERED
jgi:hypothetical protein